MGTVFGKPITLDPVFPSILTSTLTLRHLNDNGVLAIGYLQSDQRSLFHVIETSVWFARDILNFLRQFSLDRSAILQLHGDWPRMW